MKRSRILAGVASIMAIVAMSFFAPTPAQAITATCSVAAYGDSCIYWGQNYNGSRSGVIERVDNFPVSGSTEYLFLGAGNGQREFIGNNNGSNQNLDTVCTLTIWYNPAVSGNFTGLSTTLTPYPAAGYQRKGSELGGLLNNMRGQSWEC